MKAVDLLLPPDARGVAPPPDDVGARLELAVDSWVAPFVMARINTRVVHRSASLFAADGAPYGPAFGYAEYLKIGGRWNPVPALSMAAGMRAFETLGSIEAVRGVLRFLGPASGEGPSEQTIADGFYRLEVIGVGENGKRVKVTMGDSRDPGNRATVQFVCEAALALTEDLSKLPGGAARVGFLTPAVAFGDVLIERLRRGGTEFLTEEL